MALFRIIEAGDIEIVGGKLQLVTGASYVRQKISTRLKFFLGEWFLDLREGIPYYRHVFIVDPDLDVIRTLFRTAILKTQEVQALTRLELAYDARARTLAVEFDAALVAGGELVIRQPDPPFIIDMKPYLNAA